MDEKEQGIFRDIADQNNDTQIQLLHKYADGCGESFGDVRKRFDAFVAETAAGSDPFEELLARIGAVTENDRATLRSLIDDLAALEVSAFDKKIAFDALCDRTGWATSDCTKELKKEFTAAKKRRDDEKHKKKMADKKAARSTPQGERKQFLDWHHVPFYAHLQEVIKHLAASNATTPTLFASGTEIVTLHLNAKTGAKEIIACGLDAMRYELARLADWGKIAPDAGEEAEMDFKMKFTSCPRDVASAVISAEAASLGLPELNGLVHAPFFDKNSNLVTEPGYHAASGYFYAPAAGFDVPKVSTEPTKEEVAEAVHWLLFEALGDFPFNDGEEFPKGWFECQDPAAKLSVGKASRANQLAKMLQPFMEQMIPGFLPLHAVDKAAPRTGSQFLAQVMGIIALGAPAEVQPAPQSDEEWQKTILTLANAGCLYCIFDNIKLAIKSDALASAITSDIIAGRELGRNRRISGKWRGVTEVNGNVLRFDRDIAERVLLVRLDAKLSDPGSRKVFRHPSLKSWCIENRAKLVWACLTIIQNWIAKGKPELKNSARWFAGFEDYCRIMGGVLEAAGVTGFNSNRHLISTENQINEMDAFVVEWFTVFGTSKTKVGTVGSGAGKDDRRRHEARTKTLCELFLDMSDEITLGLLDNPNTASLGSRLGKKLQGYVGRVYEIDGGTY